MGLPLMVMAVVPLVVMAVIPLVVMAVVPFDQGLESTTAVDLSVDLASLHYQPVMGLNRWAVCVHDHHPLV